MENYRYWSHLHPLRWILYWNWWISLELNISDLDICVITMAYVPITRKNKTPWSLFNLMEWIVQLMGDFIRFIRPTNRGPPFFFLFRVSFSKELSQRPLKSGYLQKHFSFWKMAQYFRHGGSYFHRILCNWEQPVFHWRHPDTHRANHKSRFFWGFINLLDYHSASQSL